MQPVDAVGMGAVKVITYPVRFNSTHIELWSGAGMNPNGLAPFRHIGKVGFDAGKLLERGGIVAKSPSRGAVLEPDCKV